MFDIIINNGFIVDGTGKEPFPRSIYIKGGRIVRVGDIGRREQATELIDANNKFITPGFIDMHSHSELDFLVNPLAESVVHQGITTVLSFLSCGKSTGPLAGEASKTIYEVITNRYGNDSGIEMDWKTPSEFYGRLEKQGIAVNYVNIVGATTLRECTIGLDRRPPTESQLNRMESLAQEAMEGGAWGISTGLEYAPGSFADKSEILALCRAVSRFGGIYVTHMRSYSGRYIEAVEEAIDIGRQAQIRVQMAHNRPSGKQNWGKSKVVLQMIEEARKEGIDVTSDNFPYLAGLTRMKELIPSWAHEGGTEKFLARLQDPRIRARLKQEIKDGIGYSTDLSEDEGWKTVQIISDFSPEYMGRDIFSSARDRGADPFELAFDILIHDKARTWINVFEACWEDVDRMIISPTTFVGTDAWALAPYGVLGRWIPHPRMYGTFPKLIQRYLKEEKLLNISELSQKMSFLPAKKLGLKDRGCIKEGAWADLVIFDLANLKDTGTYTDPHHFPQGIDYVLVNGIMVVKEGNHTKSLPGMVLRHC